MNITQILGQLKSERARIDAAVRALEGSTNSTGRRGKLSAEARERIAAAQRKRWAKVKAGKK